MDNASEAQQKWVKIAMTLLGRYGSDECLANAIHNLKLKKIIQNYQIEVSVTEILLIV